VDGFRKDVRIVNLSLLNTPWYGEQLRDEEPKVPMSYTTEEVWNLRPFRTQDGAVHLVKDQMAVDIVNTAYTEFQNEGAVRPVYFAVTVDDLMDLDPYLKLEGLVFRLHPDNPQQGVRETTNEAGDIVTEPMPAVVNEIDLEITRRNLEEIYRFRGLLTEDGSLDEEVYRDSNEQKLVTNYAAAWARMALAYRALGDMDEAIDCLRNAVKIAPRYDPIAGGFGGMLIEAERFDDARAFYLDRLRSHPEDVRVYIGLAFVARKAERLEEALDWYLQGNRVEPEAKDILAGMYQVYERLGRYKEAENVLVRWLQIHPSDQSARTILDDLRRRMRGESSSGADSG
jgi:tetratricopeptide (TPR) repeat protein